MLDGEIRDEMILSTLENTWIKDTSKVPSNTIWIGWYQSGNIFYSNEDGLNYGLAYWDDLLKAAKEGKAIKDYETQDEITVKEIENFIRRDNRNEA